MKKTYLKVAMAIVAVFIIIAGIAYLAANNDNEQQFKFPLTEEDIKSVLAEQKIDMYIVESNAGDDLMSIANLRNENITFGISSQVRNNHKVLNLTWYFNNKLTDDELHDFFQNELEKQFGLAGIFYGNKKGLDKELNKVLDYYLDEKNYGNNLDWNEKVGNDHLKVQVKPVLNSQRNQIISLLVFPDELYDDYLSTISKGRELSAQDVAKAFIRDLHNVSVSDVKNYKAALDLKTADAKALSDAMQFNDAVFKSLMTEDAYNRLISNRENLKYIQACYEGNYTMEVLEIKLSDNKRSIENSEAGYDYEVKVKVISSSNKESEATGNGLIELSIIDGEWKVTGFKNLNDI